MVSINGPELRLLSKWCYTLTPDPPDNSNLFTEDECGPKKEDLATQIPQGTEALIQFLSDQL